MIRKTSVTGLAVCCGHSLNRTTAQIMQGLLDLLHSHNVCLRISEQYARPAVSENAEAWTPILDMTKIVVPVAARVAAAYLYHTSSKISDQQYNIYIPF